MGRSKKNMKENLGITDNWRGSCNIHRRSRNKGWDYRKQYWDVSWDFAELKKDFNYQAKKEQWIALRKNTNIMDISEWNWWTWFSIMEYLWGYMLYFNALATIISFVPLEIIINVYMAK